MWYSKLFRLECEEANIADALLKRLVRVQVWLFARISEASIELTNDVRRVPFLKFHFSVLVWIYLRHNPWGRFCCKGVGDFFA